MRCPKDSEHDAATNQTEDEKYPTESGHLSKLLHTSTFDRPCSISQTWLGL